MHGISCLKKDKQNLNWKRIKLCFIQMIKCYMSEADKLKEIILYV